MTFYSFTKTEFGSSNVLYYLRYFLKVAVDSRPLFLPSELTGEIENGKNNTDISDWSYYSAPPSASKKISSMKTPTPVSLVVPPTILSKPSPAAEEISQPILLVTCPVMDIKTEVVEPVEKVMMKLEEKDDGHQKRRSLSRKRSRSPPRIISRPKEDSGRKRSRSRSEDYTKRRKRRSSSSRYVDSLFFL